MRIKQQCDKTWRDIKHKKGCKMSIKKLTLKVSTQKRLCMTVGSKNDTLIIIAVPAPEAASNPTAIRAWDQ